MGSTAGAAAIVPAAGASRRMGKPKLLLPWGDSTVLESTLAALREGGVASIVVVVAPAGPLAEWQPPVGVRIAVNPAPTAGMLSSILVGLAALATTPDDEALGADRGAAEPHADGGVSAPPRPEPDPLVVCPADLPALRPSTVAALLAAYRTTGGVVVPRQGRRRGHPLLIPPRWQARMPELTHHEGGLRRILELAAGSVHEIAVDDPGSVRDVDTPDDYARLVP
ncbi:MAG TPA: nucleotidyltransferase family protein [Thermoanaerobaculia bacterium]|nr:nucleotidyltransferase family protein [Thermoanaerobaculia bacterium]